MLQVGVQYVPEGPHVGAFCHRESLMQRFAQTASKTEQIALCGYIRDGHIAAQTRKIRRHYTSKTKALYDEIKRQIPRAEARISENGLAVKMTAAYNGAADEFEKRGVAVYIYSIEGGKIRLALIPSALEGENIPQAVQVIKAILDENSD